MKHLNIATPAYDGTVSVGYCQAMQQTLIACTQAQIAISTDYRLGCCYVHKARNWLAHRFLQSSADALLFIDADVRWPAEAVLKLYESPFGVVGGAYPMKQDNEQFPVKLLDAEQNGFREALYLPTGFLLIKRAVFEHLRDEPGVIPQYRDAESGEMVRAFFQNVVYPEGEAGEDVEFCNRWRAIGGRVWCLPDVDFEHFGGRVWHGNYALHLQAKAAAEGAEQAP